MPAFFQQESFRDRTVLVRKLDAPLLTPAIKRDTGHDEYITLADLEDHLGPDLTRRITDICFQLYNTCAEYALSRGILIADAKFEFGMDRDGTLTLADELFTPDASRFWDAQAYAVGTSPKSLDKQLLRDWLQAHKKNGQLPDRVPEEVLQATGERYRACLQQLTGGQVP